MSTENFFLPSEILKKTIFTHTQVEAINRNGFSVELGPWVHRNQNMLYFDLGTGVAAEQ